MKLKIEFVTREYTHAIVEIPDDVVAVLGRDNIESEATDIATDITMSGPEYGLVWVNNGDGAYDGGYEGEVWDAEEYEGDEAASMTLTMDIAKALGFVQDEEGDDDGEN